jgi:hypothetical protein
MVAATRGLLSRVESVRAISLSAHLSTYESGLAALLQDMWRDHKSGMTVAQILAS